MPMMLNIVKSFSLITCEGRNGMLSRYKVSQREVQTEEIPKNIKSWLRWR